MRLADVSTSGLLYPFGPFAARQVFLKSQPELVSRFMKAYVERAFIASRRTRPLRSPLLRNTRSKKPLQPRNGIYEVYATKYFKRAPEATPAAIKQSWKRFPRLVLLPSGHRAPAFRRVTLHS